MTAFKNNVNDITAPKITPVQFVLNEVGTNIATKGFTNTAAGNADAIKHGATALAQIQEVKMALASRLPENSQSSSPNSPFNNGTQLMHQMASTAATFAAGAIAGPAAAAAVGLTTAVIESAQFLHTGTTHAAVDGAVGEMVIGESLNTKGGYRDIMGDTYTMSGQKAEQIVVKPMSQQLIDPQKMGNAVDSAFQYFTPDEIRASIKDISAQEKALVAELGANFKKMGIDTNVGESYAELNATHLEKLEMPAPEFARKQTFSAPRFPTLG